MVPMAPALIAGKRSATVVIHQGFPDSSTLSSNTDLSTLLKGIYIITARPRTLRETWDLPTVLKHLGRALFEPLHTAPLKSVAVNRTVLDRTVVLSTIIHSIYLRFMSGPSMQRCLFNFWSSDF